MISEKALHFFLTSLLATSALFLVLSIIISPIYLLFFIIRKYLTKTTTLKEDLPLIYKSSIIYFILLAIFFTIIGIKKDGYAEGWINYLLLFIIFLFFTGYFRFWFKDPLYSLFANLYILSLPIVLFITSIWKNIDANDPHFCEMKYCAYIVGIPLFHLCLHFLGRCPSCSGHGLRQKYVRSIPVTNINYKVPVDDVWRHYDRSGQYSGETRQTHYETRQKTLYAHIWRCGRCGHERTRLFKE